MTENPTSTKPYLIRAIHEWCTDNGFTPHIAVQADASARVPREYVKDGRIVLNIGHEATGGLQIGNELISFQARFNGVAREISFFVASVTAIYARENGMGMAFEPETPSAREPASSESDPGPETPSPVPGRPRLQRIK